MSDGKRTEIGQLGEFGLIDRIASSARKMLPNTVLGIGDDASVYDAGDRYILMSSDMLVEGVHFDLSYMPLQHLGYKSIAVNVSDIAAMNGTPLQVTANLALSNRFSVEAVELFYDGVRAACDAYNVDLVGGDTTASPSGLMVSITVMGEGQEGQISYRSGAKENDIVCVSGDLGGAYVGLQVLEREKQVFLSNPDMQPQLDEYERVVGRQLRPIARMDIIHEFREMNLVPTAMIDVSDGLASDVFHICKASGLGVSLYEDKIPIEKQTYETAAAFSLDPNTCALNGGEDYELLFTLSPSDFEKIEKHEDIQKIGYMHAAEKGKVMVTRNDQVIPLQAQGWKHF
jgi:thiamine-monophosphate kinase